MILQALTRCYEDLLQRGEIAAPGWSPAKISFALCLDADGRLTQVIPTMQETLIGKKTVLRPQSITLPAAVKKTSGVSSNFLWENSGYLLGIKQGEAASRSQKCFDAAADLHHTILDGVDVEISKAEFRYINSVIPETVQATGIGSHQLDGPGLHHLDGVQAVAYARLRKMDSDYARTERQRKIIELAFDKAKKADYAALNNILMTVLPQVSNNLNFADLTNIALSITKYHIGETMGFPSARGEANMGSKGACVIPQTLESNVSELHTFLFGYVAYTPTDTVKQISAKIASDTGMYSQGKSIGHVSTEGYLPNDSSSSGSSGSKNTETTAAESTAEPETDEDGNIIETTAADGTKHPGIGETDENGNLVDGPEEDESSAGGPGEIIQHPGSTTESRADAPVHPGSTTETTGSSSGGIVAPDGSIITHPDSDGKTNTKENSTTSTDDMRGPGMTPETTASAPHPGYTETTAADHSPSSTISETTTEAVEPGGN